MKRFISLLLLLGVIFLTGCQADNKSMIIEGIEMVPAKYLFSKIGLDFSIKDEEILLKQDNITLKLNYKNGYVLREKYILYVMEKPAINVNGIVYLPLKFFTDYLNLPVTTKEDKQIFIDDNIDFSLYNVVKFLPKEVIGALENKDYPNRDKILKAVELPRSMNIETPNITWNKIIDTTPLDEYSFDFKGELMQHGFSENEISLFTINDFRVIEDSWRVPVDMQQRLKIGYPDLKDNDISNWTYGDYEKYYTVIDKKNSIDSISEEVKQKLKSRGILFDDLHWLLKDFHNIDYILSQPNNVLKDCIEGYYKFAIDMAKSRLEYD